MDQGQKPVNPYAPAGAPYAPGSNTPPPSFAMPMPGSAAAPAAPVYSAPENPTETASNSASAGAISSETAPAVPNTSATDPAYTSFSTSASPVFFPDETPEKPKFFTKKFIIAASVGLVLIVAAIITGLVLQSNRNNSANNTSANNTQSGESSPTSCASSFYRYANYILNGTDSSSPLSEETPSLAGTYLSYAFLDNNASSITLEASSAVDADGGDATKVEAKDLEANYPQVDRSNFLNTAKGYLDAFYNCQASTSNSNLEPLATYVAVFNELADLPITDSANAEKGFELRTRLIDELKMIENILKGENE